MPKYLRIVLLFAILCNITVFGFSFGFKKKIPILKPKMPETKQQWLDEAESIPLKDRVIEPKNPPESDKQNYFPERHYVFEKYNYPPGKKELNIEFVKKNLVVNPIIVADPTCHYVAYPKYYFAPDVNQISSNFFIGKLDTSKNKTRRILAYNHANYADNVILEAGIKEIYPNLFRGLTLVDWSADGKKLLIKERVGSAYGGIYKTNLYIHFLGNDIYNGKTIKLTDFDKAVKNYFLDEKKLQLIKYRYEIQPLGFSSYNDNVIVVICYVFDKENNKIFMGTWGYNCITKKTMLISKTDPMYPVSLNGLVLKQVLD